MFMSLSWHNIDHPEHNKNIWFLFILSFTESPFETSPCVPFKMFAYDFLMLLPSSSFWNCYHGYYCPKISFPNLFLSHNFHILSLISHILINLCSMFCFSRLEFHMILMKDSLLCLQFYMWTLVFCPDHCWLFLSATQWFISLTFSYVFILLFQEVWFVVKLRDNLAHFLV